MPPMSLMSLMTLMMLMMLITLITLMTLLWEINGELVIVPRNTVALNNGMAILNCSTNLLGIKVFWRYVPNGKGSGLNLYGGYSVNSKFGDRVIVEKYQNDNITAFNVIFKNVTMFDAGIYVCQDDDSLGQSYGAFLIVLASNPICTSNVAGDAIGNDSAVSIASNTFILKLSCKVAYNGSYAPKMIWHNCGNNITTIISPNEVSSSAILEIRKGYISCTMYASFDKPTDAGTADKTIPPYAYSWHYGITPNGGIITNDMALNIMVSIIGLIILITMIRLMLHICHIKPLAS